MRLLYLFAIILVFTNKVDANTDSLKQIWTNVAQPDSIRFKAINAYYKQMLFAQPDSIILLTAYHIELAQQKHSDCLLYTSPSPRDQRGSRMPSSA